jgi:hypothetical protein
MWLTLKMEMTISFETWDHIRTKRRYVPEDGNIHNYRCDNFICSGGYLSSRGNKVLADGCSFVQDFPKVSWDPNFHYIFHSFPLLSTSWVWWTHSICTYLFFLKLCLSIPLISALDIPNIFKTHEMKMKGLGSGRDLFKGVDSHIFFRIYGFHKGIMRKSSVWR